jgi:acetoin utilization protein AcuB
MLVKDYMTRHPLMAAPTMPIVEAQRFMGENNVRHLPVVGDGKRLLGLVTKQSLLVHPGKLGSLNVWEITRFLSNLTVGDVMVKAQDVITIDQEATIEEAARVMVKNRIGCLPVLDEGIVVGIITETDLLAQLTLMMATQVPVPYVRVTVRMPNIRGELAKLVGAIGAQGWGILACGGAPSPRDPTKWDAVLKISYVDEEAVVAVLEQVEGQEIVDVREM